MRGWPYTTCTPCILHLTSPFQLATPLARASRIAPHYFIWLTYLVLPPSTFTWGGGRGEEGGGRGTAGRRRGEREEGEEKPCCINLRLCWVPIAKGFLLLQFKAVLGTNGKGFSLATM